MPCKCRFAGDLLAECQKLTFKFSEGNCVLFQLQIHIERCNLSEVVAEVSGSEVGYSGDLLRYNKLWGQVGWGLGNFPL